MQRREALRLLLGTAALPLLPPEVHALFQQARKPAAASVARKTLNLHQDATVTAMAEMILPQTDTPGAKAVRVNEFIEVILTEWCDAEERKTFLDGLAGVDSKCRRAFGRDFIACTATQQKQMLTELDAGLTLDRQAGVNRPRRRREKLKQEPFFYVMKQLTLMGYFTSEEGATQMLHYQVIPSQHTGCAPLLPEEARK